jgi:hypothetical protein
MEKEFVTYQQALALSDLGFKQQNYFAFYHKGRLSFENLFRYDSIKENPRNVDAPLKQQVFRWFREKYNISVYITDRLHCVDDREQWKCVVNDVYYGAMTFNTYEEAENACIDKLIEIAKPIEN